MKDDVNRSGVAQDVKPGGCRVYEMATVQWIVCLEEGAAQCPHALTYGPLFRCEHPDRKRTFPVRRALLPPPPPALPPP